VVRYVLYVQLSEISEGFDGGVRRLVCHCDSDIFHVARTKQLHPVGAAMLLTVEPLLSGT
jgi:hypothetical protein